MASSPTSENWNNNNNNLKTLTPSYVVTVKGKNELVGTYYLRYLKLCSRALMDEEEEEEEEEEEAMKEVSAREGDNISW